jgi:hypothetical protein
MRNKLIINYDMKHYEKGGYIIYKNIFVISTEYSEYDKERSIQYNEINKQRYDKMWVDRNVYK